MNERRKTSRRRVNPPQHGLPPYYTRDTQDRRQSHAHAAQYHAEEIHSEHVTPDMFMEHTHTDQ